MKGRGMKGRGDGKGGRGGMKGRGDGKGKGG